MRRWSQPFWLLIAGLFFISWAVGCGGSSGGGSTDSSGNLPPSALPSPSPSPSVSPSPSPSPTGIVSIRLINDPENPFYQQATMIWLSLDQLSDGLRRVSYGPIAYRKYEILEYPQITAGSYFLEFQLFDTQGRSIGTFSGEITISSDETVVLRHPAWQPTARAWTPVARPSEWTSIDESPLYEIEPSLRIDVTGQNPLLAATTTPDATFVLLDRTSSVCHFHRTDGSLVESIHPTPDIGDSQTFRSRYPDASAFDFFALRPARGLWRISNTTAAPLPTSLAGLSVIDLDLGNNCVAVLYRSTSHRDRYRVRVIALPSATLEADFTVFVNSRPRSLAFDPSRRSVWISEEGRWLHHLDLAGQPLHTPVDLGAESAYAVDLVTIDNRCLAIANPNLGEVIFLDTTTAAVVGRKSNLGEIYTLVAIDHDRRLALLRFDVIADQLKIFLEIYPRLQ